MATDATGSVAGAPVSPRRQGNGSAQRPVTYAALDLGTNNCRLLIARPTDRGFRVVDGFTRIVRLGEGGRLFEAWVWLATGLAGIPSVWLWNRVAAGIGLFRAYAVGCAVELVGVVGSVSMGGYAGPLIGGVLLGATFIGVTALGLQASRRLVSDAPRRIIALMTASFGLGQIIGPVMAGYLADWTGSFVLPSLVAAAALGISAALVANIVVPRSS